MTDMWRPLLKFIRDESKYHDIALYIWCIARDYKKNKIDIIADDEEMEMLERIICQQDGEWAITEIPNTKRCERCSDVFIQEDINPVRVKINKGKWEMDYYCDGCFVVVEKMLDIYDTGDESSDSETESEQSECEEEIDYLNASELQDEIARGR